MRTIMAILSLVGIAITFTVISCSSTRLSIPSKIEAKILPIYPMAIMNYDGYWIHHTKYSADDTIFDSTQLSSFVAHGAAAGISGGAMGGMLGGAYGAAAYYAEKDNAATLGNLMTALDKPTKQVLASAFSEGISKIAQANRLPNYDVKEQAYTALFIVIDHFGYESGWSKIYPELTVRLCLCKANPSAADSVPNMNKLEVLHSQEFISDYKDCQIPGGRSLFEFAKNPLLYEQSLAAVTQCIVNKISKSIYRKGLK